MIMGRAGEYNSIWTGRHGMLVYVQVPGPYGNTKFSSLFGNMSFKELGRTVCECDSAELKSPELSRPLELLHILVVTLTLLSVETSKTERERDRQTNRETDRKRQTERDRARDRHFF